jgi:hypothetical protein
MYLITLKIQTVRTTTNNEVVVSNKLKIKLMEMVVA